MQRRDLLILDFDGVICDSLPECFVSSWYAYHHLERGESPASTRLEAFGRFSALRPYIRSGEDYLLIQQMLDGDRRVSSQAEFDAALAEAGAQRMSRYKSRLYEARQHLLGTDAEYWERLNPLYPHMREGLLAMGAEREAYILSTKRAPYIVRILQAAGVRFPEARVLYSGSRPKSQMIVELLGSTGRRGAIFVDDQVDHFAGSPSWSGEHGTIECRLASWGYVRPEWLAGGDDYRVIGPEEMLLLLRG